MEEIHDLICGLEKITLSSIRRTDWEDNSGTDLEEGNYCSCSDKG